MMLNKYLTKIIIFFYNVVLKGNLFGIRAKVKKANESDLPFDRNKLSDYLLRWGYDPNITKAPLSNKEKIKTHTQHLNPKTVYKFFYTGGSTGEPLKLPHSKSRAILRTASILYYNQMAGYDPGDRYLFIRSKPKSRLFQFLRNEILFVPNDLSQKNLEYLANILVGKKVEVIIGYPSVIFELAVFLKGHPEVASGINIKTFISGAEPLGEDRCNFISQTLNCRVIDRYSNEENGVIAHQRQQGGEYIVDRYNLYVEVLNPETLLPVKEGETGKVVVTDICSDLIPMVRYDTGDFAVVAKYKNGQLWSIKQIMGRVVDNFYTTSGKPFCPLMLGPYIRHPLTNLPLPVQFQMTQLALDHFILQLKTQGKGIPDENINKVIQGLKSVLGNDAEIEIRFVKNIPSLPSGKRPLYRNEMSKEEKEKIQHLESKH